MSYFKKARKYNKPSVTLDEKIAKANKEFEKTGVELSEWSGNKTSGIYYAGKENPEIPAVESEVPDSNGFRSRDPSLPAENASDIDPSDSSTWENGGKGMERLINSNTLPVSNGDDVSNQPIVVTPDLTGFKHLLNDSNDPDSGMGSYGGIAYTYRLGVWGKTTGIIGPGNKFVSVLAAFGWPTGPGVSSDDPSYPSDRKMGGFYRMDDDATYFARLRMKDQMSKLPPGTYKPYKCWMPFNSYGFGQTWTQYKANPNNIWRENGDAYVTVHVYDGPAKYTSSNTVPSSTTVIFKDDIGKAENLPFGGKLKEFLEKLFGIGGSAIGDLAGGLPYGTPGADDPFGDWDDDLSDDDLKDDSDFNPSEWDWAGTGGQGDDVAWGKPKPKGPPTEKTRKGATDAHAASTGMYPSMTPEKFKEKYGMSYDEYLNLPQAGQSQSSDWKPNTGTDVATNYGDLKGWEKDILQNGLNVRSGSSWERELRRLRQMYPGFTPRVDKGGGKTQVANYEPQGQILTEKNHLRDLREKKREKTKKVADKIFKINIPGPNDHLTVKAIDMLRQYKVSEKEMQEYVTIIGQINQWIRDNPKEYAIWKIRYPANDPRLAELNWILDQQLKASAEYVESRFPENQKLFAKLQNKIQTNINVTDPANFKDVKPAVTHKQLLRVSKAIET